MVRQKTFYAYSSLLVSVRENFQTRLSNPVSNIKSSKNLEFLVIFIWNKIFIY